MKTVQRALDAGPARGLSRYGLPVLLLVCLLYYIPGWFGGLSYYHDDSLYITTAHSLATGHGYRIESLPGTPRETKYPILFPALLALLWKIDPDYPANTVLFKCANTLLWLATLALTYRLLVRYRYATPLVALITVGIWGLSPGPAFSMSVVLSEPLCALTLMASLLFCEASLEADSGRAAVSAALLCGLFAGLAVLTRAAMILLWPALAWVLWRHRRRLAVAMSAAALPLYAGWLFWSSLHPHLATWDLRMHYLDYTGWALAQFALTPWPLGVTANIADLLL